MARGPLTFRQRDLTAAVKPPRQIKRDPLATHDSVVYVVGFGHYLKIGFSRNFRRRRNELQEYLPRKLEFYLVKPGTQADERALHARFSKYRLRGEWFLFAGELADWLEDEVGLSDRRKGRRAEQLPEHRLQAIQNVNANAWLNHRYPNEWDEMFADETADA